MDFKDIAFLIFCRVTVEARIKRRKQTKCRKGGKNDFNLNHYVFYTHTHTPFIRSHPLFFLVVTWEYPISQWKKDNMNC